MAVKTTYFFGSYSSYRPFIIQVNSGADGTFTIPTSGGGYNYKVSTSDGQNFSGVTGNLTITFPSANTLYDISISGDFTRIYFNNTGDKDKIIDIKQWGEVVFDDFYNAFNGAINMAVDATDVATVNNLTRTSEMFRNNHSLVSYKVFDMSNVVEAINMHAFCQLFSPNDYNPTLSALTNGQGMYYDCIDFNPPNYAPTLSALTNGQGMYFNCIDFNPPNYAPTLSALTNGVSMYHNCFAFNPIGWQPDLSNATVLRNFLEECHAFSQDISSWDVSSCVNFEYFKRHQNPNTSSLTHDILWDSPTTGSISAVNIRGIFRHNKSDKIAMQCGNVALIDSFSFQSSVTTKLILIDLGVSFDLTATPNVLGVDIDNLANSVADLTGGAGAVLTLSLAQSTSGMDASLWAAKNWTLNII